MVWGVLAVCSLAGCISDDAEEEYEGTNITVGDVLPNFSIALSGGSTIDTSALKGKVSVIMLFSVTCSDCQKQFPVMEQIYEDYKAVDDVQVFGISRAQGEEEVSAFWTAHNYCMPYSAQEDRYVYSLFAKSVVPRIYVSDRNNIVSVIYTDNPLATYEQLTLNIETLLNE